MVVIAIIQLLDKSSVLQLTSKSNRNLNMMMQYYIDNAGNICMIYAYLC